MTQRLEQLWDYPALATFYKLRKREATAVARAVVRFAEEGRGKLTREGPHWKLRAGAYIALVVIDPDAMTLAVLRLYRRSRQ